MTSNQPYLLRAFYEWIVDNDLTPYIVVDATIPGTLVPQEHVKDGQIVLNISPSACSKLQLGNVDVSFEARFSGMPKALNVPCRAVLAIYAKENGAGTVFTVEDEFDEPSPTSPAPAPLASAPEPVGKAPEESGSDDDKPKKKTGRPNLKVVK